MKNYYFLNIKFLLQKKQKGKYFYNDLIQIKSYNTEFFYILDLLMVYLIMF